MSYTVTGRFRAGKGKTDFTRTVDAESEKHAKELALTQLTSEHSISRANITVDDVTQD